MFKLIKYILTILLIILTFLVFNEPGPVWFFPLFLLIYLLKNPIRRVINFKKIKLPIKYVLVGLMMGLFIEFLAILSSMKLPPEQRALFHPEPIPDLILSIGCYTALMIGSYFILKKYYFSLKQFFIFGGIYGLILEEHGGVLLQLLSGNILGGIYVFLSYGSLLAIPYLLFNENFNIFNRKKSNFLKYLFALLILLLSYMFFLIYYVLVNPIVSS
jgi:hypothetical protein